MGKFTKKKSDKGVGAVNTASLPDIVFMILFFFMVVTTLKDKDPKVSVRLPKASEVTKIEDKTLVKYINIGKPMRGKSGGSARIQLNDDISTTDEIAKWVEDSKKTMPDADRSSMIVSLKVDQDTKMGVVTSVKEELRQTEARKILYAVNKVERTSNN